MAQLFKGMSQDKFLDSLVEKTGLNGHELYDYLMGIVKKPEPKEVETKDFYPVKDEVVFRGTRQEALQYIIDRGATEMEQKLFKASSYGFAAAQMAAFARARKFFWEFPARILNQATAQERVVVGEAYGFWNEDTQKYDICGDHEKMPEELWSKLDFS